VVVPGPFGPIETRSRPLWTVLRPCCARFSDVHAPVLVLRSRHRWFDSQRRLYCPRLFMSLTWCDVQTSGCGRLGITGEIAPVVAYCAPKARLRLSFAYDVRRQ